MSAPEIERLGILFAETSRVWRTKLNQRLKPLGLSQGKWMALVNLFQAGDGVTQKEIAERMGLEEPTLVGLLHRLENDGWIQRRSAPEDRRCKLVFLLPKAKRTLQSIFEIAAELRHELIRGIPSDDLATCMHVLGQIRDTANRL